MSFASARKKIDAIVEAYAASKSYPVEWEGRAFTRPTTSQPWLAVYVLKETSGEQVSLGDNPWYRRYSMIQININTENGLGREANDTIAQELSDLYIRKQIVDGNDTLDFFVPDLKPVGVRDGRYVQLLTIPYMRTSLT
jgi:hypothetical protein